MQSKPPNIEKKSPSLQEDTCKEKIPIVVLRTN